MLDERENLSLPGFFFFSPKLFVSNGRSVSHPRMI